MARILVVEDEPTIAMGLRDDLELEGQVVDEKSGSASDCFEGNVGLAYTE